MSDTGDDDDIQNQITSAMQQASIISGKCAEERVFHLKQAEELLLHSDTSDSFLDNFLDEMLAFASENDAKMRCYIASFIERACMKDKDVFVKAGSTLLLLLDADSVEVSKSIIGCCSRLYPVVLNWAAKFRTSEAEICWELFSLLKSRILRYIDSENEGIRKQTIKFIEMLIISQTARTEGSETSCSDTMCLNEIPREHRFLSHRKLENEATLSLSKLLGQVSSTHISSLNLVTCIDCLCKIGRLRPQFMHVVIDALESLQRNLPPTLSTNQVKSVRKELKAHLMRILRHRSSSAFQQRLETFLNDLGASSTDLLRSSTITVPKKRSRQAYLPDGLEKKRSKFGDDTTHFVDKADDELNVNETDELSSSAVPDFSAEAIRITADFIRERLNPSIVQELVLVSLANVVDEMHAEFGFISLSNAGSVTHIKRLSWLMASQMNSARIGPGFDMLFNGNSPPSSGSAIPRRKIYGPVISKMFNKNKERRFTTSTAPFLRRRTKINSGIISITKELPKEEALNLILLIFDRILDNERRAVQGGAGSSHHSLVIRLVTRFESDITVRLKQKLVEFILQEQKTRTDLLLLWIAELYAQYQGFSHCHANFPSVDRSDKEQLLLRYDEVLCYFLQILFDREEHKEPMFHKILLEAPLLTEQSFIWLQKACLDPAFGAFGITTLRELIITRARQRHELLNLLLDLMYCVRTDVRQQSVETAKELYQMDYIRNDVRDYLTKSLEYCVQSKPHPKLCGHLADSEQGKWNEITIRAALSLFIPIVSIDPSLMHNFGIIYARASTEVKRLTLRAIDSAVKAIGGSSADLLRMIDECPLGAETLAIRIVHLLTERNSPTPQLVASTCALYDQGRSDIRSLVPVLTGLDKERILNLLPKFVLNVANQKSLSAVYHKLLLEKNVITGRPTMSGSELLIALLRIQVSDKESTQLLFDNIDLLLIRLSGHKEAVASAIDAVIGDDVVPCAAFHTIVRAVKTYPALGGFISNILLKATQKRPWATNNRIWPFFTVCVIKAIPHSYLAILTGLKAEDFGELVNLSMRKGTNLLSALRLYIPTLSAHLQKRIDRRIREAVMMDKDITSIDSMPETEGCSTQSDEDKEN